MEGRIRTMSAEMHVNGTYIMDTFLDYLEGNFYVNRKYQRKLVWTLDEKQAFIDTILRKYPVPIFLVVRYKQPGDSEYRKDIIDGLQRFNAIFSFIKNEYAVKSADGVRCYFNISTLAGANELIEHGVLHQKTPVLSMQESRSFLNYQLPITTTEVSDSEVEEIFRRINSTGRKLSKQDLRQAGSVSLFSDLVRKTACYVRGDISELDIVGLADMPILSLSSNGLNYGIDIRKCFWIRHGILTSSNIRISRDEELIARIYGYMLLGNNVSPASSTLDKFYDVDGTYADKLNEEIKAIGILELMDKFSKVLGEFERIFRYNHTTFNDLIFKNNEVGGKSKVFQSMFLALYELQSENYKVNDYRKLAVALKKIENTEFGEVTNDASWNVKIRNSLIRRLKSILCPMMIKQVNKQWKNDEWKLKLETQLLAASGTEKQMYDFKLGFTTLKDGNKNRKCISGIIKTLTAMANTRPGSTGTVIVGIANDKSAALAHQKHYGSSIVEYNGYYVTGIDDEIKKYWNGSADRYCRFLSDTISSEPIEDSLKSSLLKSFELIEYEGKTLLVLQCKLNRDPFSYNKEFYVRYGSNTVRIETGTPAFNELMSSVYSLGTMNIF